MAAPPTASSDVTSALTNPSEEHRMLRERQIVGALADRVATIPDIVKRIYVDVAPALHPVAALSVESHLKKLLREGRAREERERDRPSRWTLIA